ncbi:MAG: bifunctional diguanylate cyclase/phosphodiesterase [Woeseia sp.]
MTSVAAQAASNYDEFSAKLDDYLADNDAIVAVIIIEASNTSRIDARFGRKHRDAQLDELAVSISAAIRDTDYTARIGEQAFAVIIPGLKNKGHATLAGRKLLRVIQPESPEPSRDIGRVTCRLGIALSPDHSDEAMALIRRAQLALEIARDTQQNLVVYDNESVGKVAVTWELRDDLAEAIRESELEVFYQPKLNIQTGEVYGAESLVRWFSDKRGTVPPDIFIPVAENSELIQPLTRYMLNTAMRNMMMWQRDGHNIGIAVNLPAEMLIDGGIVSMLESLISIWDLEPGRLTLELTESALMQDIDASIDTMTRLRALGARISIDDFGTGYSSFSYFKNIPADELKIDQAFISSMVNDIADQHIVETIIGLAHRFGMKVVAEGIEDEATLLLLKSLGCDIGQGYYIAKPLSQQDYDAWLDARRYIQPDL